MTKRRADGEGSLWRRRDGLWVGNCARPTRGCRFVYGKTRNVAAGKLDAMRDRVKAGQPAKDTTSTVGVWVEHWCEEILPKSGRRQGTVDTYRSLARTHIVPGLGKRRLNQLRPSHVEGFLHNVGERRAASTVRQVYAVSAGGPRRRCARPDNCGESYGTGQTTDRGTPRRVGLASGGGPSRLCGDEPPSAARTRRCGRNDRAASRRVVGVAVGRRRPWGWGFCA